MTLKIIQCRGIQLTQLSVFLLTTMKTILPNIIKGDIEQLKKLKQQDPTFHWLNLPLPKTKETALHLAAQRGNSQMIDFLLNQFTPKAVDVRNIDFKTPLHESAQFGHYDCVRILIGHDADVNAIKRSDWTALMLACTKPGEQYEKIVEYLIQNGALINFKNKDGWTALHLAARNPNSNLLKTLLNMENIECKIETNNGRNALHVAALHGNIENVKMLTAIGIDPNLVDSMGNSPFHEAVLSGNIALIDFLIENGADYKTPNKVGMNALHLAAGQNLCEVVQYLFYKYNFDLNCTDSNGYTPIQHATRKNNVNVMNTLNKLQRQLEI